ncbi:hypothetical protein FRC15_008929 [Serendipita sp. 397]|nr:hypothetical protein FRC15_008929 [Serendipita sp. 397]
MPYIDLITNVKLSEDKQLEVVQALSKTGASVLGKPESYMSASYTHNSSLIFAGTTDPCFQIRLISIGLTVEKCPEVSRALSEILKNLIGLDSSRGYMQLTDPTAERTGYSSTTFGELWK